MNHKIIPRIPLIFRFPRAEYRGHVGENVQNIDIAPTLLDYLGIQKPQWMAGQSLISQKIDACRSILTVKRKPVDFHIKGWTRMTPDPPFYNLGSVTVIVCNQHFKVDLYANSFQRRKLPDALARCTPCSAVDPSRILDYVLQHLSQNGYDTSSIKGITLAEAL